MPRPNRKSNKQTAAVVQDKFHNRTDRPCCHFLQNVAQDILVKDSRGLAAAVRRHLQEQLLDEPQMLPSAAASKKKKKRKKKKKMETPVVVSNNDNSSASDTQPPPSQDVTATSDLPPTSATTSSSSPPPQRIRLLRHYLAQILPTAVAADTTSSSANATSPTIQSFVEYLHQEKAVCQIETNRLELAVQEITCENCRAAVQHQLRHPPLRLTFGCRNDPSNGNHFDYVALEEGLLQGTMHSGWYWTRIPKEAKVPPPLAVSTTTVATPPSTAPSTSQYTKVTDDDYVWELRYSGTEVDGHNSTENRSNDNPSNESNHWTLEHLIYFLENGILLPSLPIDELMGTPFHYEARQSLTASNTNTTPTWYNSEMEGLFWKTVNSKCHQRETQQYQWARELEQATKQFHEETAHHDVGNVEMSSFPIMQQTDETCQKVLQALFSILLDMTASTMQSLSFAQSFVFGEELLDDETASDGQIRQWTARQEQRQRDFDTSRAFQQLQAVWESYSQCIYSIIEGSVQYEMQVNQDLATAQGNIPGMYCSAKLRSLYRAVVDSKIQGSFQMVSQMQAFLDSPVNLLEPILGGDAAWEIKWFNHMVALKAFQTVLMKVEPAEQSRLESSESLDEIIQTVLTVMLTWMLESVHQGTVQKVLLTHEERREKLASHIEKLLECCKKNTDDTVSLVLELGKLLKHLTEGKQETEEAAFSDQPLDRADQLRRITKLRAKVWASFIPITSSWFQQKLSRKFHEKPAKKYGYQWLMLASSLDLPFRVKKQLYLTSNSINESLCSGSLPQFRVECIFQALLYRWMDERFQEWQSWVAQQELLTSFGDEPGQDTWKAATGKKNKKKKNTTNKKLVAPSNDKNDVMESTGTLINGSGNEVPAVPSNGFYAKESFEKPIEEDDKEEDLVDTITASTQLDAGVVGDKEAPASHQEEETEVAEVKPNNRLLVVDASNANSRSDYKSNQNQVGLFEGDSFEPAEMFLVSRFQNVLEANSNTVIIGS